MRVHGALGIILGGLAVSVGCDSAEVERPENCLQEDGPRFAAAFSAQKQGRVRVRDLLDETDPENVAQTGLISASFVIPSNTSTGAKYLALGDNCLGRISSPVPVAPQFLAVKQVELSGLEAGTTILPAKGEGKWGLVATPFLSNIGSYDLKVEGSTVGFPSIQATAQVPGPHNLKPAAELISNYLPLDEAEIHWQAGDADAITIELVPVALPGQGASGGQVICQVADDGCYLLPRAATHFLWSNGVEEININIRRTKQELLEGPANSDAQLLLSSEIEWKYQVGREPETR